MASLILPIDAILPHASAPFGVKARTLTALARGGFPVPAAYALSAEAAWRHFGQVLPAALHPHRLFASRDVDPRMLEEARDAVLGGSLDAEVADGLSAALRDLGGGPIAVRASSTAADVAAATASGLHTATLGVGSEREVHDAVRAAWTALFRMEVVPYASRVLRDQGGPPGVVLQAMIPARVSGVLFTAHPLTGTSTEMLLNAYAGPDGDSDTGDRAPDTYRIDKERGWVRDRVPGDVHARRMLDEHLLGRLIELGLRIEQHAGGPRRVHWAVDDSGLHVLDSREFLPQGIEPLPGRRRRASKRSSTDPVDVVWSRAFIGEVLPAAVSPLTWSLLRDFTGHGLRESLHAMGCNMPARADLLGNFRGRAYLSLTEVLGLAAQVPGLRAGVDQRVFDEAERQRLQQSVPRPGRASGGLRLARLAARFIPEQVALSGRVQAFSSMFDAEVERVRGVDLRVLPSVALDATLSDVHRLLDATAGLAITVHAGLLACVSPLRSTLEESRAAAPDQADQAPWQILVDDDGQPSVGELPRELARVADVVGADVTARAAALAGQGVDSMGSGEGGQAVRRLLARFGHLAPTAVEVAEPRLREHPELLLRGLALHVQASADGGQNPWTAGQRRAEAHRGRARARVDALRLSTRVGVEQLLGVARHFARMRARLLERLDVALALMREVAVDASRRIRLREPACGPDGAFLLTLGELHAALRGELGTVAPLLSLRREQGQREDALPSPPESFVGYPRPSIERMPTMLQGQPAGGGSAQGEVQVVASRADLASLRPGTILVLPSANLGVSPLFATASGVIVERGGMLSPASMLARQLGLPMAVHVRGALSHLRSGHRVRLDGDSGIVHIE